VVWVQNNQAVYVSTSAHGEFNVYPASSVRWEGTQTTSRRKTPTEPGSTRPSGKVADVDDCNTADGTDVRLWTWLSNYCQ